MHLDQIRKVYFIGIGGIGMSAIARFFHFHGKEVSGYDKTSTVLTQDLINEGMKVHFEDDVNQIPKDADLVVYTPAVPKDHQELNWYINNNTPVMKRSQVLGIITKSTFNICIAGTHGKTTITTMVAHLLRDTGYGCNAFLGGIAVNYNSNYWSNERAVCVVEADEYDRSFLQLHPNVTIISAMDPDHLDIYGDKNSFEQAFIDFSKQIKEGGLLIQKKGLSRESDLSAPNKYTYGNVPGAEIYPTNIKGENGSNTFDVVGPGWKLEGLILHMAGWHNVENITAAIGVAKFLKIEDEKIKAAVASFKGVKRRFEYIIKEISENHQLTKILIDDYAHHPEELKALLNGARKLFPDLKMTIVFQPHLYSRTRDFAEEFSQSLSLADEVYLMPIYPARELPIPGVTSAMVAEKITVPCTLLNEKEEILSLIQNRIQEGNAPQLLITAGAGNIDTMVKPLAKILNEQ